MGYGLDSTDDRTEVYADESGINVFHFDGGGNLDWAANYFDVRRDFVADAVADFVMVAEHGRDPAGEGWGHGGYDSFDDPVATAGRDYDAEYSDEFPVAASWYRDGESRRYLHHDDPNDYTDVFAREFAEELIGGDKD